MDMLREIVSRMPNLQNGGGANNENGETKMDQEEADQE